MLRALFNQLSMRLILGALVFLLGLTGAVILVVRDSLRFSALNMENISKQVLLDRERDFLLELARREAELCDHAIQITPGDLSQLNQRLQNLDLTPNTFSFVLTGDKKLLAVSSEKSQNSFAETTFSAGNGWRLGSVLGTSDPAMGEIIDQMQSGLSGVKQVTLASRTVIIAYAPMTEAGWSLAVVTPTSDILTGADSLSADFANSANNILQATLVTIGYFSIIVIIGIVLTARALTKPIKTLVEGTRAIATGDLSVRLPIKSGDELGVLAAAFNEMAGSLQKRTEEFTEAHQTAVKNAHLLEQARAMATVEERQRLARELHDSVTQSLYSLTLLAEASRRTALNGEIEKVISNISRLGEIAQQALKEMRLLVYELRPLALEQAGLVDALQYRLEAVEKRAGIDSRLKADFHFNLPAEVENDLYRIAQEALNNALKHAEASVVSVLLQAADHQVVMEIVDNGKGFDPENLSEHGGLGLISIRERVEALGGTCLIQSKPGSGTRVMVTAPLERVA